MNERHNGEFRNSRFSAPKYARAPLPPMRRPFWLPASNYYILAVAATIAFFFIVWAFFHEGEEESPMLFAGIGASLVLGGAVLVREVFLRNARKRFLVLERKLDYSFNPHQLQSRLPHETNKLSLERNAAIIKDIQKKSDAARGLGRLADEHFGVFEVCNNYLSYTEKQMETVGVGSPRIAAIRRGREIVGELHRYHLLSWAEIESRSLTQKARNYVTISEKLNTAQEALTVLDSARQFYPNELQLIESQAALKDFISSIKVSHWIEQAERAAFKENYKKAVSLYRDALFFLAREDVKTEDREAIAEKINFEIESLRALAAKKELNTDVNLGRND